MSTISGLHPDNAHTSKFPHRVCNRILDWPCVLYFLPLRYFPIVTIGTPISSIALLTVGIWFAGERYTWDTTSASQSDSTMLRIKFLYRVTDVTPVLHEVTGGMHPTGDSTDRDSTPIRIGDVPRCGGGMTLLSDTAEGYLGPVA